MKMLKSADLEGRGFQKEEFRKMLSTGNTNSSAYTTTLYYFKMVKCSGAMQIVTKLDKLFPGWSVRALFSAYDLFDLKFIIQLRSIDKQKKNTLESTFKLFSVNFWLESFQRNSTLLFSCFLILFFFLVFVSFNFPWFIFAAVILSLFSTSEFNNYDCWSTKRRQNLREIFYQTTQYSHGYTE